MASELNPSLVRQKGAARQGLPLLLLLGISTCAFIDRTILNTVGQAIKDDLQLSDLQLGILGGAAFALLYSVFCVPIARFSEHHSRVAIVCSSVIVWSLATWLCAFASSFAFLLLARVGVGIGEAGVQAPSQSLLADIYPPQRRASAVAILGLATPLGIAIGGLGGGYFAQHFGWRSAFAVAAVPGLLLAAVTFYRVPEPTRGASEGIAPEQHIPSLQAVLARLWASRAFRHILVAGMITAFIGFGMVTFTHAFFVRAYSMSYTDAAIAFVLMNSVSTAAGFLVGGLVTDRLIKRDVRAYCWLPAAGAFIACPLYILGYLQPTRLGAIAVLMVPGLFSATWFAPTFAVTQNLVTPRMRASAVALTSLAFNLVGMTFGPSATGAASDFFAARAFASGNYLSVCSPVRSGYAALCQAASASGIRFALILLVTLFVLAGLNFMLAAKHLRGDLSHLVNVH